jgi:hypothetical protein
MSNYTPTPSSGQISFAQLGSAFGTYSMASLRSTTWYQPNSLNTGTFSSSNLGINQFYNKQGNDPASTGYYDFTAPGTYSLYIPLYRNLLQIRTWGGGGGGGRSVKGGYADSGGQSYVSGGGIYLYANGGAGGGNALTDRFGGVQDGYGGAGGGAAGGNYANSTGGAGSNGGYVGGDCSGGNSPNGGGRTPGVSQSGSYDAPYPGNYPGGGGCSFFFIASRSRFPASGGGGGGGGYAESRWNSGTNAFTTVTIVVAGGGGGQANGANGRVIVQWS